jgi:hypothetical protein
VTRTGAGADQDTADEADELQDLEPEDHAHLLVAYRQKRGRFGWRPSSEVKRIYPFAMAASRVRQIGVNRVLHALGRRGGVTRKRRRKEYLDAGEVVNRHEYFVPKPRAAQVVAMPRRTATAAQGA